jgi:hypothetical protein
MLRQDNSAWLNKLDPPVRQAKDARLVAILWGGGAGFVVAVLVFLVMGLSTGWRHTGSSMALSIECDQAPGGPVGCWLRTPIIVPAAPARLLPPIPMPPPAAAPK